MPAVSQQQAKFFRWASHNPEQAKAEGKYPKGMTQTAMHDFAATPDAGLPKRAPQHMADGGMPRYFAWKGHSVDGNETMFPSGHVSDHGVHQFAKSIDGPKDHLEDGGGHWIQNVTSSPSFHKGALTAKAHKAGESPMTFAREHAHSPGKTGAQSRFAINAQK